MLNPMPYSAWWYSHIHFSTIWTIMNYNEISLAIPSLRIGFPFPLPLIATFRLLILMDAFQHTSLLSISLPLSSSFLRIGDRKLINLLHSCRQDYVSHLLYPGKIPGIPEIQFPKCHSIITCSQHHVCILLTHFLVLFYTHFVHL